MADDFGYLNARIRARRGEFLPESFFKEGLRVDFSDFLRLLAESPYGAHLAGENLPDVDRAVAGHFAERVADLRTLASGEAREAMTLLFMRADLANIKSILRAKATGRSSEEVQAQLVGGSLPESLLQPLIEAPDAAAMAQVLVLPGHPVAKALREAARTSSDAIEVEMLLDRLFLADLVRRARAFEGAFAAYFQTELEVTNLATAFKLASLGEADSPERYFIPGGQYVTATLFGRIAAGEVEAVDELGSTPLAALAGARALSDLERAARCLLLERAGRGALDVMGPGLALEYVRRKEWEGARIRLLARRAYYALPAEPFEKEVTCA